MAAEAEERRMAVEAKPEKRRLAAHAEEQRIAVEERRLNSKLKS